MRPHTSRRHAILALVLSLILFSGCGKKKTPSQRPVTVRDDVGRTIHLSAYPKRIVSLAPNVTEIIFALGAEDRLVGVTAYCDYPPAARSMPKIGGIYNPNYEKMVQLNTDLVIATKEGRKKESIEYLDQFGIQTFVSHASSLEGIFQSIENIAELVERSDHAKILIDSLELEIKDILASIPPREQKLRVLFLLQVKPLFSIGTETYIHQILSLLGLDNVGVQADTQYPKLSRETVLVENPDLIIMTSDAVQNVEEVYSAYPEWQNINALRKKQVFLIDSDLVSRPGPRIAEALRALKDIVIQID